MLPRWGKQHSAGRRMFSQQLNAICRLSVLWREFAYDTCRCRDYLLPRQIPNSVQINHTIYLASFLHATFTFIFRQKPDFRLICRAFTKLLHTTLLWHMEEMHISGAVKQWPWMKSFTCTVKIFLNSSKISLKYFWSFLTNTNAFSTYVLFFFPTILLYDTLSMRLQNMEKTKY